MPQVDTPIIVALDFESLDAALALADHLDPQSCRVKVGKELFTRAGPAAVTSLSARGFEVFLDLKFHDIPNTVAGACRAAADLGCWMINIHAGGGRARMEAAAAALADQAARPWLIAVTVLTSLDNVSLAEVGVGDSAGEQVVRLATLAAACGVDGVVCSPLEIGVLRACLDSTFKLVTPGVRPSGSSTDDQRRVATPAAALRSGADYLVIGRPVTRAKDPAAAVQAIAAECREALA